jgi:hypothetical protein
MDKIVFVKDEALTERLLDRLIANDDRGADRVLGDAPAGYMVAVRAPDGSVRRACTSIRIWMFFNGGKNTKNIGVYVPDKL